MRKIDKLKLKAMEVRCQHLTNWLQLAKDRQDEKAAADILHILHRNMNKKRCRRVDQLVAKPIYGQVLCVQVDCDDGSIEELPTKEGVYATVKVNLSNRFRLAFTVPSC